MRENKALIGAENGEWELRPAKKNADGSYSVGPGDYVAEPQTHIQTLKIKTAFGVKRYRFFAAHIEDPIPLSLNGKKNRIVPLSDRRDIEAKDSAQMLRSFRRAHIVEGLGRASRELPGNNQDKMKIILVIVIGIAALVLYYTGVIDSLIGWLTSSPS